MNPETGARAFAAKDEFLSKPYQKYEWLVYRIGKVFGKENVTFQSHDFGFSLILGVTRTGEDGKLKRCAMLIRRMTCQHRFKFKTETGYGSECEDAGDKGHKVWDVEQKASEVGRHKFIDETIKSIKAVFENKEENQCQEAKVLA